MAAGYYVVSSFSTVQVLSGNTVIDVEYVNAATTPTGIGFSYAIPVEVWKLNQGGDALPLIAAELENMVENYHVVGGDSVQTLDVNGLLADSVDLVVEYARPATGLPPLRGTVNVSMADIYLEATDPSIYNATGRPTPQAQVEAEYQRLAALAGA